MTRDVLARLSQCRKSFDTPPLNIFVSVLQHIQAPNHNILQLHIPYTRVSHVVADSSRHTEDFETYQAHADPMALTIFKLLPYSDNYATFDDLLL